MTGRVVGLYIAANAGGNMQAVLEVKAIQHQGLEGDRYAGERGAFSKSGRKVKRQVTLIEIEAIERVAKNSSNPFEAKDTRRNIVVSNFPLNRLVGKQFTVGDVYMRGVELCDPCDRPDALSGKKGFAELFKNCGGLRAEILSTEIIKIGDMVEPITYKCLLCGTTTLYPHVCPEFYPELRK